MMTTLSLLRCVFLGMLLCAAGSVCAGCGRKGPPKPPENFAPLPVQFFSASGTVDGILLKWVKPEKTAEGKALEDLESFEIMRAVYAKEEDLEFEQLVELEYELPEEEEEEKKPAKKGEKKLEEFSFLDTDVSPGGRYVYYVVPYNEDGVGGRPSQALRVTFIGDASQVELYAGAD